jgi:DNA polymerase III delta prime subunit
MQENISSAEESIIRKLDYFHRNQKIPHIIFYGPTNSNKDQIVSDFINKIYGKKMANIKQNVLFVSCSGKGIKFIRDEIKTFSKMHIQVKTATTEENGNIDSFKTVVLMNADFLTDDAQSALRRSIELFSYNTRFFLLVENRSKLLKPILSRFCEIYVPPCKNWQIRLHSKNNHCRIQEDIAILGLQSTHKQILETVTGWIEMGFSSYDFMEFIDVQDSLHNERCIHIKFLFHKWKTEFRCEKLFLWFLLDFFLFRNYKDMQELCCH